MKSCLHTTDGRKIDIHRFNKFPVFIGKIKTVEVFLDYYLKFEDEFLDHSDTIESLDFYNRYVDGVDYLAISISDKKSQVPRSYKKLRNLLIKNMADTKCMIYLDLLIETKNPILNYISTSKNVVPRISILSDEMPQFKINKIDTYLISLRDFFIFKNIATDNEDFNQIYLLDDNIISLKTPEEAVEKNIKPYKLPQISGVPYYELYKDLDEIAKSFFDGDDDFLFYPESMWVSFLRRTNPEGNRMIISKGKEIYSLIFSRFDFPNLGEFKIELLEVQSDFYVEHAWKIFKHINSIISFMLTNNGGREINIPLGEKMKNICVFTPKYVDDLSIVNLIVEIDRPVLKYIAVDKGAIFNIKTNNNLSFKNNPCSTTDIKNMSIRNMAILKGEERDDDEIFDQIYDDNRSLHLYTLKKPLIKEQAHEAIYKNLESFKLVNTRSIFGPILGLNTNPHPETGKRFLALKKNNGEKISINFVGNDFPDLPDFKIIKAIVDIDYYQLYEDKFLEHSDTIEELTLTRGKKRGIGYLSVTIGDDSKSYKVLRSLSIPDQDVFVQRLKLFFTLIIKTNNVALHSLQMSRSVIFDLSIQMEKRPYFLDNFTNDIRLMSIRNYLAFKNIWTDSYDRYLDEIYEITLDVKNISDFKAAYDEEKLIPHKFFLNPNLTESDNLEAVKKTVYI